MKKAIPLFLLVMVLCTGMAHAGLSVGILSYDPAFTINDMQTALEDNYYIDSVTVVDISSGLPTLTDIQDYDVVVIHSQNTLPNASGLGDLLADYVDIGNKGLVLDSACLTTLYGLAGRIVTDSYLPIDQVVSTDPLTTPTPITTERINNGFFTADESEAADSVLASGATSLGTFSSGAPYGAYKGDVVALNYWYADSFITGDKLRLLTNAVLWAGDLLGRFEELATMPEGRSSGAFVKDDEYFYWVGGNFAGKTQHADIFRYNIATDTWDSSLAAAPVNLGGANGVLVDGKIYVPGGSPDAVNYNCNMYIYDIDTDSWSTGTSCSIETTGYGIAYYDGYIYRFGGYDGASGFTNVASAAKYEIATDTWTDIASMSHIRWEPSVFVRGGKIFIAAGNGSGIDNCEVYDPDADSYDDGACADLPGATFGGNGTFYNGLFFMGASRSFGFASYSNTIWVYDPVQDLWYEWLNNFTDNNWVYTQRLIGDGNYIYSAGGWDVGLVEYDWLLRDMVCTPDQTIGCDESDTDSSTSGAGDYYNDYSCTDRDLSGGDYVYEFTLANPRTVTISLSAEGSADLDVLLLSECDPSGCMEWGDDQIISFLPAGTYYIVVDGFEGDEEDFDLDVTCCDGCVIGDTCYADGDPNPANDCEMCSVSDDPMAWTAAADGETCDDGEFCNGDDTCSSGVCDDHAGDPCEADESCNETTDSCDPLTDDDDDTTDDDDSTDDDDTDDDDNDDDDTSGGGGDDDDDDDGCCGC